MSVATVYSRIKFAGLMSAALAAMAPASVSAQTVEYFGTPWVYQPINPISGQPTGTTAGAGAGTSGASLPSQVPTPTAYSNIFGFATQVGDPRAPAWQFMPRIGVNEILTDNIEESYTNRQSDLESQIFAGFLLGADTSHLTGLLDYSGVLQENINETKQDHFSNYAFLGAHATLIPGSFFFDVHGSIDDELRQGGGIANPLVQNQNLTQSYIINGSPYYTARLGEIGLVELRYQFSQAWFDRNTDAIIIPGLNLGDLTGSTQQQAGINFKFPGTIVPRVGTHITLNVETQVTGAASVGTFFRTENEAINEVELTRSISIIGGAGYEDLRDKQYARVTGNGATWDAGVRWQPNADSSLLLVYGHHDLKSDISGELQYRVTPFTSVYVSYTDSIGTAQQNLIAANDATQLNPAGPVSGVTFDQSPVLATLNDAVLAEAGDTDTAGVPLGIPLSDVENFSPLQNDIFRTKLLDAILYTNVAESPVTLTVYNSQQISLARLIPPETTTRGVLLSWAPALSENLVGVAQAGYNSVDVDHAHTINFGVGLQYDFSPTLSLSGRYDYITRQARVASNGFIQNAVTISVNKNF